MAKDFYHQEVRTALEKEGWKITHDPYRLKVLETQYEIDLGAELTLAAEKEDSSTGSLTKIAVEIKSFRSASPAHEFHSVLGQYLNYVSFLELQEPNRVLYLAVPQQIYDIFFVLPATQYILERYKLNIITFDSSQQLIQQWLPK